MIEKNGEPCPAHDMPNREYNLLKQLVNDKTEVALTFIRPRFASSTPGYDRIVGRLVWFDRYNFAIFNEGAIVGNGAISIVGRRLVTYAYAVDPK